MKVCIFGCGWLGLTIACGLAEIGHDIYFIESSDYKVDNLKKGIIDTFEPDIQTILLKHINNNKIKIYHNGEIDQDTDVYVIATDSFKQNDNLVDSYSIEYILEKIITSITKYSVILNKSAVSIGETLKLINKYKIMTSVDFDIVVNPEFIRHGSALYDFLNPDRIIVGSSSNRALEVVRELYKPFKCDIIQMDETSAEITKLATDAFLATKISFINEIANLSASYNADITKILSGFTSDKRIGEEYFQPGIGFGGKSLLLSLDTLIWAADKYKTDVNVIKSAKITNETQKRLFISKILKFYNYNIVNKVFSIWGLSFKKSTSSTIDSQSNTVIDVLKRYGASVKTYDPFVDSDSIEQYDSKEGAVLGSDALIILNDNDEFKKPNFDFLSSNIKDRVIFDARNLYTQADVKEYNLNYYCTGIRNE